MPIPPRRHLPERPSLEQLRKQAREHLETLRAADPSVNLAAAQHALAREYGFESWPKLLHHVESMQARSHYDYRKPLYFAVRENRIDVVRFLLEHDRNPLDLCAVGRLDIVQLLLDHGADPQSARRTGCAKG